MLELLGIFLLDFVVLVQFQLGVFETDVFSFVPNSFDIGFQVIERYHGERLDDQYKAHIQWEFPPWKVGTQVDKIWYIPHNEQMKMVKNMGP